MAKYKQGYSDRMDESLGMRRGKESGMSQSYKSRRDESRGMNDRYMPKGMNEKVMGHDKKPSSCNVPVGDGFKEVKPFRSGNLGYPSKAFDYKY